MRDSNSRGFPTALSKPVGVHSRRVSLVCDLALRPGRIMRRVVSCRRITGAELSSIAGMAQPGEKMSDHDRIEEMQARLAGSLVATERLLEVASILSERAPEAIKGQVRPLLEAARLAYMHGVAAGDTIVDHAAPVIVTRA